MEHQNPNKSFSYEQDIMSSNWQQWEGNCTQGTYVEEIEESHTSMSPEEEDLIHRLHNLLGDRWSLIAGRLPNRSPEEIQQYWEIKEKHKVRESKLIKPKCGRLSPSFRFHSSGVNK